MRQDVKMSSMPRTVPSGQTLLANFQNVFVSKATLETAHYEADRSEDELLQHLQSVSSGAYLQPTALAVDNQDAITKASLDAHIKKVQADQLDSMSAFQFQQLQQESQSTFVGHKVRVSVRLPQRQPIEAVWFDQHNGYRNSPLKRKLISGTIKEVILDKNVLIIKPSIRSRLLNSSLQNYVVYVIDPDNLLPMVDIAIL